ncbi:MAG: PDZ domain-containing protein [Proteobacteria bacterium]|nr:PDZ domain-containing protein [Pseudomonadota bacterium]
MKKKSLIYWGISVALIATGIAMSIAQRDGHYEFDWRGSELMAQPKVNEYHNIASLQVFNRVLLQLQQNYVDPTRLDPHLMIASTLDNLQKNMPELLLVFDKKVKEKPTKVTVNLQGQSKTFSLENISNLWEMSLRLRSIVAFIQDYLPKDAKPRELEYEAINGMLSALDPHSLILSPESYRSMAEGNRGKFGGLGIVVRMIDGVLIVVEPITGDVPAKRAGIEEGDQILAIDGTPTLNMNISEAVELLKGEPDTTVHLTVMRQGWKTSKIIDVVRAEISIPSLESEELGDKIGYIKLKSFQGNSQKDLAQALEKMSTDMGSIEGLILDLRGNPGGLLDQAVLVADNFLDEGAIVTTVGVSDMMQKTRNASKGTTQPSYPIIVLLDSSSASASEIVAGALKNNDRALIVGDTSFGKGSVQVLYELPDKSALKLTIGQYLTPGNQSIQSVGIVPDIRLVPMRALPDDIDLYPKPWVRREESLGGHLDSQHVQRDLKPAYNLRYLSKKFALNEDELDDDDSVITLEDIDKIIKSKTKINKPVDDPQVRLAKEILLKNGKIHKRQEMIKKFLSDADELQKIEDQALVDAMKKLDIDWSACTNNTPKVSLTIDTDKDKITAGDEFVIHIKAKNDGNEPVCRLAGRSESSFARANDKEVIFGKIDPGQEITRELKVKTNRAQSSRVDNFDLKLYLDDGTPIPEHEIASAQVDLETVAQPQPAFKIHYAILDKDGDSERTGNSLLDDNEEITMRIWVSNDGPGTAEKPLVYLKNKSPEIKLLDARAETEAIATGQRISRDFKFKTMNISAADIPLELHVYDKRSTQVLVENIAFKTSKSDEALKSSLQPSQGTMRIKQTVPLYVSPVGNANHLTDLPENTIVNTDAVYGDYTHIIAGELTGWITSASLEFAGGLDISEVEPKTIATIPRISMSEMKHVTDSDKITIEADVTSFAPLTDYYIYTVVILDHTYVYEKVAYGTLSNDMQHIRAEVPLNPGLNSIKLYVRDSNKSESRETAMVFRKTAK